MIIRLDGLPCVLRQSCDAARHVTGDVGIHEQIAREVLWRKAFIADAERRAHHDEKHLLGVRIDMGDPNARGVQDGCSARTRLGMERRLRGDRGGMRRKGGWGG